MKKRIFMYFSVFSIVLSMFSFSVNEANAAPYKIDFWMYEGDKTVTPPSLTLPNNGQKMYIAFNPTSTNGSYYYRVYRDGTIIDHYGVNDEAMYSENFSVPGTYSIEVECIQTNLTCEGQGYLLIN